MEYRFGFKGVNTPINTKRCATEPLLLYTAPRTSVSRSRVCVAKHCYNTTQWRSRCLPSMRRQTSWRRQCAIRSPAFNIYIQVDKVELMQSKTCGEHLNGCYLPNMVAFLFCRTLLHRGLEFSIGHIAIMSLKKIAGMRKFCYALCIGH